jgi:Peptidase family S41/N-terminal domain of Peptidase_S41 in eukaryotic IRBP
VELAEMQRMQRRIEGEVKARFPAGAVRRVAVLQHGDDPVVEPGELLVRVFIEADAGPDDYQRALDGWAREHQVAMRRMRRELSLRLPPARLLEFTVKDADGPGAAARITMPDDPALTDQPVPAREAVETALSLLRAGYVFPDLAERAAAAIEARLAAGEYDDLSDEALAERLTAQLAEVCADKHLRVRVTPPRAARRGPAAPPEPGLSRPDPSQLIPPQPGPAQAVPSPPVPPQPDRRRPHNYGIYRVQRLEGNVGYLDLRGVADPDDAGPAIAAAMELVSGTYALIIDLRQNHGGSPHGVVFWCSYLFPDGNTHLNDIFDAHTGETRQFWSLAALPGERYLDRPVYLLASHETFSGGEDFCYTLQAQHRAEVIGEATGGGAHPTRMVPISATLAISLPHARSINPVTGTNWQGTGVIPDLAVPAAAARDVAYGKALRHVLSIGVPPPMADEARGALAGLSAVPPLRAAAQQAAPAAAHHLDAAAEHLRAAAQHFYAAEPDPGQDRRAAAELDQAQRVAEDNGARRRADQRLQVDEGAGDVGRHPALPVGKQRERQHGAAERKPRSRQQRA